MHVVVCLSCFFIGILLTAVCVHIQALATKTGTMTPMWMGLYVMLKYRSARNYRSWLYLFGRLFDKTCFTFLTATFYLWVGADNSAQNEPNIAGLLFMW